MGSLKGSLSGSLTICTSGTVLFRNGTSIVLGVAIPGPDLELPVLAEKLSVPEPKRYHVTTQALSGYNANDCFGGISWALFASFLTSIFDYFFTKNHGKSIFRDLGTICIFLIRKNHEDFTSQRVCRWSVA